MLNATKQNMSGGSEVAGEDRGTATATEGLASSSTAPSQSQQPRPQRRKLSTARQSRFSIDYFGFPRINDESEDSDLSTGGPNNNNKTMEEVRGNRRLQYLATLAANLGAVAFGVSLSYPSVALPSLREDKLFKVIMTETDESWIGAMLALGVVVSGPIAGSAIERMGRRMSMLVLSVPFFLSWMLINVASTVSMILIGRFLTGVCSGILLVAGPIFTAEVVDPSIRGAVGASFDTSSSLGILFIYIIGAYCSWSTQALICATIPIFIFIIMLFVPESPAYLLEKGNIDAAKTALTKYKATKNNPDFILTALEDLQQEVVDSKASENASFRDLLARPILIPVSVVFMVFVFQVICGLDPILVYTVDIFKSGEGSMDEYTSTVIFGVIELVAGVLGTLLVDKTGRRFLLLVSEAVMVASLVALGFYFFLKGGVTPTPPVPPSTPTPSPGGNAIISFLPLTSLSLFILAYSIGLGPVGYLLMGEILPLKVKGLAGCLLTSAKWMLSFLLTKFFNQFIFSLGEAGTFWLFASCCACGFVYIFIFVPETNGRSLEDIQRMFRRRFSLENIHFASSRGDIATSEAEPLLRPPECTSLNLNTAVGDNEDTKPNPERKKSRRSRTSSYQSMGSVA